MCKREVVKGLEIGEVGTEKSEKRLDCEKEQGVSPRKHELARGNGRWSHCEVCVADAG